MAAQFVKQNLGSNSTTGDIARVVSQMQDNLGDIFAGLGRNPVAGAVLLRKVSLAAGSNQIAHTLGRTLTGWIVTRIRGTSNLWDDQDNQPLPSTYLTLLANAPVSVDILVF